MEQERVLEDCPACRGVGALVHDGGWCVQVECADCGAHTVYLEYDKRRIPRTDERMKYHKIVPTWRTAL